MPHPSRVQKTFRYYLSYLWDQKLETAKSPYNPYLEVLLSRGRLQLNTKNVTYSYEDLYRTFYNSFAELHIVPNQFKRGLVLGGGLGSIPCMLEEKFDQKAEYDMVEIDEVVIRLAQKHLPTTMLESITFFAEDAYDFVMASTGQRYDLITVDVFLDMDTPNKFRSKRFLQQLNQLLQPNGWLLFNTLTIKKYLKEQGQEFYKTTFQELFPNSRALTIEGNFMLVYQKQF